MPRCLLIAGTALLAAAMLVSPLSPAHASPGDGDRPSALGGFHLGDALEAAIDEQTGAFRFGMTAGGLNLGWDSRALAVGDRAGLGRGWSFGIGHLDTVGGVRVFPASGGVHAANASSPSGLDGHESESLRFEAVGERELAARADGSAGAVRYAYTLTELGGVTTYFSGAGDPLVSRSATGQRIDYLWDDVVPHRLISVVDADGVVTDLDWLADRVEIRPAANLPGDADREPWTILLGDHGVTGTVDPIGTATSVTTDGRDLVTAVHAASGTTTEVTWASSSDGAEHVDRVRSVGVDGRELSLRTWSVESTDFGSSGWPALADGRSDPEAAGTGLEYTTVVDDGRSRVRSTYNDLHSLIRRAMTVSGTSGERVLQEQAFAYPSTDEQGRRVVTPPSALAAWGKPTTLSVTFHAEQGAARTERERSEFDEFGRQVSRTAADGTVTQVEYDREIPADLGVPIGLPLVERTIAPDGLVDETRFTLNDSRTAVVATERATGRSGAELVPAERVEYTVQDDGFVTEERAFPVQAESHREDAPGAAPRVTRHERAVDLTEGVAVEAERLAAGTPDEVVQTRTVSLVHGGIIQQTDAVGNVSTATYDQVGRQLTATDAAGRTTETTYETWQRDGRDATTSTRPDGVAVTEQRDELGRVTTIADNLDHGHAKNGFVRISEQRDYPAPGVVRTTDAWGATTTTERDALGRVVRTVAPNGLVHVTEHDDVAGVTTTGLTATGDLADARSTSTSDLDLGGRVVSVTGARDDGVEVPAVATAYDGLGREVLVDDGLLTSTVTRDEVGRPATTALVPVAPASNANEAAVTASRDFDGFGSSRSKLLVAGDDRSLGRVSTFDALGRVRAETDQRGGVQTVTYTPDGLVAKTEDGSGATTTTTYDDETRLPVHTIVTSPVGEPVETAFEYDPLTDAVVGVYDPSARSSTEIRYEYDDFGNTTRVVYPDGGAVEHTYDAHGRLASTTDVAGLTTVFAYDAAGLMTSARQAGEGERDGGGIAYEYDELGRTVTATRDNGVVTRYEYTSANEVAHEISTADGVTTAERTYAYDPHGRLVSRTDHVREPGEETRSGDGADALTATTTAYTYDALDRLVHSAVHDGDRADVAPRRATEYDLSIAGDVERETVTTVDADGAERTTTRTFEYSPVGELLAVTTDGVRETQEYDAAGNLVRAIDGTAYVYDAANRRVAEQRDGVTTETAYWADGSRRRLSTTEVDGVRSHTEFYWDGDALINDAHSADAEPTMIASYLIGVDRHARTVAQDGVDGRTEYFGTDRHGNTTELTDESGAVSLRYEYADYGATTTIGVPAAGAAGQSPAPARAAERAHRNPIQYAGEYADHRGTLHLAARDYDTVTMRFQSMDVEPLRSRYAFGDLNPVMNVDPSGHDALRDTVVNGFLIGLGVVAAIATMATMVTPVGPAAIAASVGAWGALVGDVTSIGIAISLLVDDSFDVLSDHDREALSISGTVIGAVSAFGPALNLLAKRFSNDLLAKRFSNGALAVLEPDVTPLPGTFRNLPADNPFVSTSTGQVMHHVAIVRLFQKRALMNLGALDVKPAGGNIDHAVLAEAHRHVQVTAMQQFVRSMASAKTSQEIWAAWMAGTDKITQTMSQSRSLPLRLGMDGKHAWARDWANRFNQIDADMADADDALRQLIDPGYTGLRPWNIGPDPRLSTLGKKVVTEDW